MKYPLLLKKKKTLRLKLSSVRHCQQCNVYNGWGDYNSFMLIQTNFEECSAYGGYSISFIKCVTSHGNNKCWLTEVVELLWFHCTLFYK